jgi:hypothetical protein
VLGDLDGFTWTNACQPNEGTALYGLRCRRVFEQRPVFARLIPLRRRMPGA